MYDGFKERAKGVQELLHQTSTSFLVVSTLDRNSLQEAAFFHKELERQGYHFGGYLTQSPCAGASLCLDL